MYVKLSFVYRDCVGSRIMQVPLYIYRIKLCVERKYLSETQFLYVHRIIYIYDFVPLLLEIYSCSD